MKYTFYWLTGKREVLEGNSPEEALNQAGIGQGAIRVLDFWAHYDNNDYVWNAMTRTWDMTLEAKLRIFK